MMYIVTNRIEVKKGFAEKMAPRFTSNPKLEEMPGFNRVEVSLIEDDNADTEEMYVTTWWDSEKDFENWKNSDAFKQAHQRSDKGASKSEEKKVSPFVGSNLVKSRVLTALGKLE